MIFSSKIFKITNGKDITLFAENNNELNLYIYDKSLKYYQISTILNRNCVFCKNFNYKKIIQLNSNSLCLGSNGYITLVNKNDIWNN